MYEVDPLLYGESTELRDLETFLDDYVNNDPNTIQPQPPSTTLSEFEAQVQAMLAANNNDLGSSGQNQNFPNNAAQDFNNFQYSVPTSPDDALFSSPDLLASLSSPDSFLSSPNLYNTFDDNTTLSPSQFNNNLQDFVVSPNDTIMQDSGNYSSTEKPFFDQLTSKKDFDTLNLMVSQQVVDNAKKRVNSTFDRDSVSPDKSLKKRKGLNNFVGKSTKRSTGLVVPSESSKVTLGKRLTEDEQTTSSVSNMLRNNGTTQSIVVPSSPADLSSSNYATNAAMLAFNQGAWNQTINSSTAGFVPDVSSKFTSMPLLVLDGSTTAKLPINRLKPTVTNTQPQQNIQSQPNKQQKKVAHNAIERRYRNNINNRINDLKNAVPALCHLKSKDSKDDDDIDEVDGIPAATKLNKATILKKATEYITYLKSNNQKVKRENETLKKLIEAIPGGIDLYNAYITQLDERDEYSSGCHHTPPESTDASPNSSIPTSPDHQDYDYNTPPTPPDGNSGSRVLMALFMCMTFFTSQSSYTTQPLSTDHHHESLILTNSPTPAEKSSFNGIITIDIWYLTRIFTFLACLTYILRPSLFSSQPRRLKPNPVISSVLNAKNKDPKALYRSLSGLSNRPSANIFEIIGIGLESIKFFLRRVFGWDITSGYTYADDEGRLYEIELWGRMGEVELCGGNDKVSRISILFTCLHTINLLESPYTTKKYFCLSPSRIYANAALQCYIGLKFPFFPAFLAEKFVAHFWKLANNGKVQEKWLEIALNSDQKSEMWKEMANRINYYNFEKSYVGLMKNITIPLTIMTDAQAMIYLKQAFYNFISTKYGGKKGSLLLKNQRSFSFTDLVRDTTPNSFTHWYALVGCSIEAFHLGNNKLGENYVNRLKDYPAVKSDENNYDKQIIAMGLSSYELLMQGKLEASLRCANKASIALTKRKELRNGAGRKVELLDELNNYSFEIEQDIHYLTEFCVGWIVLEAKSLGWKIVEGLSSSMNTSNDSTNPSAKEENEDGNENQSTTESSSITTKTTSTTTTSTSKNKLPNMLDSERLQNAITLWTRYLRRLSKNTVFEDITKIREIFIKKLVRLESIVSGDCDNSDDDFECEDEEHNNHNGNVVEDNNNSQQLNESEIRATKVWSILKGM